MVTGALLKDYKAAPYQVTGPAFIQTPESFKEKSKYLLDVVHAQGAKMFAQLTPGLGRNYPGLPSTSENIVFGTADVMSPEMTSARQTS